MANGFFLGGIADAMTQRQELGLRQRALGIQEATLQHNIEQDTLDRADKAIGDTMGLIGETIKGVASKPDLGTGPDTWASAIANIESGGNYGIQGPVTKSGDRAYGKYQVMGANIPEWTREVLGTALTPEQFLANPDAQDKVFQAKFGQYVQETGRPDLAALKWFTGSADPNALGKSDVLGTTGVQYMQKFNEAVAAAPRQKVQAVVAPLLKDVTDIAKKVGKNPEAYTNQVKALIDAAPIGIDAALQEGVNAAKKRIGEMNGLIRAGVDSASAALTAGIKPGAEGLDPNQIVTAESTMRNQYNQLSKDFVTVRNMYSKLQASMTGTPAGDISLIFSYMRMLDPASTVRESEFATAQQATGVPGQIVNLYNQVVGGQRLNQAQRQDFANLAGKLFTAQQSQQTYLDGQFRNIAKRSGLNPLNVVVDLQGPGGGATPNAPETVSTGEAPPTPDGFMPNSANRMEVWNLLSPETRQWVLDNGGNYSP